LLIRVLRNLFTSEIRYTFQQTVGIFKFQNFHAFLNFHIPRKSYPVQDACSNTPVYSCFFLLQTKKKADMFVHVIYTFIQNYTSHVWGILLRTIPLVQKEKAFMLIIIRIFVTHYNALAIHTYSIVQ